MSSPADQLAQIQTTAATNPTTLAELAAQQKARDTTPSDIEQQARADVDSLETTVEGVEQAPADQQGLLTQPKNIAATRSSIFSTQGSQFVDQGVSQKTARLANQPVNTRQASLYSSNSVEAVIAADSATQSDPTDAAAAVPSYDSLAERMAVPMPNSSEVEQAQKVAMGDTEIPVIDTLAAHALTQPEKVATQQVATAELAAVQAEVAAAALPATRQKAAQKKSLTLADLFRKSEPDTFDRDRFSRKKVVTRSIPNMQTAALSDQALPGVSTNAMFPTTTGLEDGEHHEDEEAEGLMQLAALPSMTRIAPNGIYVQTDKVEVGCLRPELVSMIRTVENHYKRPAIVTSGFRDPRRNRRAGGVRHSLHTMCAAADIQVQGVSKWQLADFLRSLPGRGGVGTYCHTESVHIDIGGERDWNWRCRRKKRKRG